MDENRGQDRAAKRHDINFRGVERILDVRSVELLDHLDAGA
jgi:hypothetical protein